MKQRLKSFLTNLCYKFFKTSKEKIDLKIKNADIISFDIFDTLIKRNVKQPTDVFSLVEREYNKFSSEKISGFKEVRISAEKKARNNSSLEEVTLEEIYGCMDCYNKDVRNNLLNLEIQVEKDICTKNNEIYNVYMRCLEQGKTVIFTSDMYLPFEVIKDILLKNEYTKYDNLYLSSEKKVSKSSGHLFQQIIKDYGISSKKILHMGDNPKVDFFMPKRCGIASILINKNTSNTTFQLSSYKGLDYNILSTFINNNLNNHNLSDYEKFGYEIFGPILYSFTTWLHEKIVENKIEKIYFLARDAKIIMEIYEKRFGNEIPIYYLNVSRKSVLKATISDIKDFDELYFKIKAIISRTSSVADFLKILNLKKENYTKEFQNSNINIEKLVMDLSQAEKDNLFNIIYDDVLKQYREQNAFLRQYLRQNDMYGNVALVDIGWNGTMQYYLEDIVPNETTINGYYYAINKDNKYAEYRNLKREGYLFDAKQLSDYQSTIQLSIGIFETMFLSFEGSTLAYKEEENKIKPVYGDVDCSKDNLKCICDIQNMAKKFVKDFSNSSVNKYTTNCSKTYFENYNFFATNSTNRNMHLFENIKFNDVNNERLIEHKSIFYYIFHPKKLYIDFKNSRCKIMFVKATFKIKIPYYKMLKKMYNKKVLIERD